VVDKKKSCFCRDLILCFKKCYVVFYTYINITFQRGDFMGRLIPQKQQKLDPPTNVGDFEVYTVKLL
jgi:hypothetical protein